MLNQFALGVLTHFQHFLEVFEEFLWEFKAMCRRITTHFFAKNLFDAFTKIRDLVNFTAEELNGFHLVERASHSCEERFDWGFFLHLSIRLILVLFRLSLLLGLLLLGCCRLCDRSRLSLRCRLSLGRLLSKSHWSGLFNDWSENFRELRSMETALFWLRS
jgi:hypothetical protein